MAPYEAIGHLVGLQAQTATSWYLTLWSRLRDFDPVATGRLLEERRIVRSWFMRATIHLVTDAELRTVWKLNADEEAAVVAEADAMLRFNLPEGDRARDRGVASSLSGARATTHRGPSA